MVAVVLVHRAALPDSVNPAHGASGPTAWRNCLGSLPTSSSAALPVGSCRRPLHCACRHSYPVLAPPCPPSTRPSCPVAGVLPAPGSLSLPHWLPSSQPLPVPH